MKTKLKPSQYLLQAINYTAFMAGVWFFSVNPPFHILKQDEAMITLAFGHTTKHLEECKRLTQEEMLKLPPNMRVPMECKRGRSPLSVELQLDDKSYIQKTMPAPGLFGDQGVDFYQSIKVPVGEYRLLVWLNDDVNKEGATFQRKETIHLTPSQHLIIEFDANAEGFSIE